MIIRRAALLGFAAMLVMSASAWAAREPVKLQPQPGTELDTIARKLVADELNQAAQKQDAPLVLVAEVTLGGPKQRPALFVQLQSARECGSAGCSTTVYVQRGDTWGVVLDSIGGPIEVDSARHRGLRDLIVDKTNRWVFNGKNYVQTEIGRKASLTPAKKQ